MEGEDLCRRLPQLRTNAGVSARDMSLSIGQSPNDINRIESGKHHPTMEASLYVCDCLEITSKDFFDVNSANPTKANELIEIVRSLPNERMNLLIELDKAIKHS